MQWLNENGADINIRDKVCWKWNYANMICNVSSISLRHVHMNALTDTGCQVRFVVIWCYRRNLKPARLMQVEEVTWKVWSGFM